MAKPIRSPSPMLRSSPPNVTITETSYLGSDEPLAREFGLGPMECVFIFHFQRVYRFRCQDPTVDLPARDSFLPAERNEMYSRGGGGNQDIGMLLACRTRLE